MKEYHVELYASEGYVIVEYKNSGWKNNIVSKCVKLDCPEHRIKFIELLEEAGYENSPKTS